MTSVDEPAGHGLRRYFLFEKFTLIDPDEMRRRRASWPAWRRALRPIGAVLWWTSVVLQILVPGFSDRHHPGSAPFVLGIVTLSVILVCVVLGVGLEWRDRRRERRPIVG